MTPPPPVMSGLGERGFGRDASDVEVIFEVNVLLLTHYILPVDEAGSNLPIN